MTVTRLCMVLLLAVCPATADFLWFHHTHRIPRDNPPQAPQGTLGTVVKAKSDSFTIRTVDTRVVTYNITESTVFFHGNRFVRQSLLRPNATVAVDSISDLDGKLSATSVMFQDNRPVPHPALTAEALAPGGVLDDPVIAQARVAAEDLRRMLPNFICQQSTVRLWAGADRKWRNVDQVTAEVLINRGHETYRDIKLNGRLMGTSIMGLPGANSNGEFGTTLRALLDPQTAALFKFQADQTLNEYSTAVYQYAVSSDHSNWIITAGSQSIVPPYTGRIWIDRKSGNVVRIEKQAADIPAAFPFRMVDVTIEYGPVALLDGAFFLPVSAINQVCQDIPKECSRNQIDFRNYHRYVGETSISFDSGPDTPEPEP